MSSTGLCTYKKRYLFTADLPPILSLFCSTVCGEVKYLVHIGSTLYSFPPMSESPDRYAVVRIHHSSPTVERAPSARSALATAERLREVSGESGPPVEVVIVDTAERIVQLITHGTTTTSAMNEEIDALCPESWSVGSVQ